MKFLRYFIMGVLLIGITGIASATKFQILDPSGPPPPTVVYIDPGVPFTLNFGACPSNYSGSPYDATGCAEGYNESSVTLTSLDLSFTAPPGISLDCSSDSFTATCSFDASTDLYTLDFSGCGSSFCGIAPGHSIWFLEDLTDPSDPSAFPTTSGVANTPEPSSLLLALSSMGPLGYLVRRRRRNPRA